MNESEVHKCAKQCGRTSFSSQINNTERKRNRLWAECTVTMPKKQQFKASSFLAKTLALNFLVTKYAVFLTVWGNLVRSWVLSCGYFGDSGSSGWQQLIRTNEEKIKCKFSLPKLPLITCQCLDPAFSSNN